MQEALKEQGISVTRSHVTTDTVYITYKSHATNSEAIVTELETVMVTILEKEGAKSVQGAILHTKRPLIGLWEIDRSWLQDEQDQRVDEYKLLFWALQTLRIISFK